MRRSATDSAEVLSLSSRRRARRAALLAFPLLSLPLLGAASTSLEARYPYDPACPWGRLSNGQGMLHRCLSEAEATQLATKSPGSDCPSEDEKGCGKVAPDNVKGEPLPVVVKNYEIKVGPIQAEDGDISVGRLALPLDRYKKCVLENGGSEGPVAHVVVKFLVRSERLRAEGVSVARFDGVSKEAAQCIADVVDRRKVGAPSVPMTGAQLHFEIQETK